MKIYDPYETTYGSLISTNSCRTDLIKYISTTDTNALSYEYYSNEGVNVAFITGVNEEERELPVFDHPMCVKDIRGNEYIVSDVRKYVNPVESNISLKLEEIVRDKNGLEFVVLRALLTKDFKDGKVGLHRNVFKPAATAMSTLIASLLSNVVGLDPVEKGNVEIATACYFHIMLTDQDEMEEMTDINRVKVIKGNYSIKFTSNMIEKVISKVSNVMVNINDLVSAIKAVLPEEKSKFVNLDVIVNMTNNLWYGHGGSETTIISLEHLPTFLALVYVGLENKSYKKTRLAMLLDKSKRSIGNDYSKHFELYLKERTL
jgi:hypothetical protein